MLFQVFVLLLINVQLFKCNHNNKDLENRFFFKESEEQTRIWEQRPYSTTHTTPYSTKNKYNSNKKKSEESKLH